MNTPPSDDKEDFALPQEKKDDKPFDDTPFDAGVEANEADEPKKFIQQLSGKLGQSLRKYTKDQGQPDFELEKFAINSVISATNTADMDVSDQNDIIDKIKSAGAGEKNGEPEMETPEMEVPDMETPEEEPTAEPKPEIAPEENPEPEKELGENLEITENLSIFVDKSKLEEMFDKCLCDILAPTDTVDVNQTEATETLQPEVKPDVKPTPVKTPRRSKPWKIKPGEAPKPKAQA
jgi:hypothetical protein